MLWTEKLTSRSVAIRCVLALSITFLINPSPVARADGNPDEGWTETDQTIPIDITQINACNGDAVVLSGEGTYTTRVKVQPDGSTDLKTSTSTFLTGSGEPSGAEY